ncbi:MAG: hypothetical protein ABIS47_05650 [Acidimicrobiales bacterium]
MSRAKYARVGAVLTLLLAVLLVPARPAAASVGLSTSLTLPALAVGQTGRPASFTITNTNTAPQGGDANLVTVIRLVPSCGTTGTAADLCSLPDPGVFTIGSPASGGAGTSCAGQTFTVSAPDAIGAVTFTPGSPVFVPVGNPCTVNFTINVLKTPTIDSDPAIPGVQTRANLQVTVQHPPSGATVTSRPSAQVTVGRALPTLTTQASRSVVAATVADTATVTGAPGVVAPTGTVTFSLYGPTDVICSGGVLGTSTSPLSGGTATSGSFAAAATGTYRFVAAYNGDANYATLNAACNAPNENVIVTPRRAVTDFDGNGTTDVSVFRPSNGLWYVQSPSSVVAWGQSGDISVAGDYDGDGKAEQAVFRPSTGIWYLRGPSPRTTLWGAAGDIPVPADYDGNGTTDVAVFRPSTGLWYVQSPSSVVAWGQSGDVPVPGDYDGDGRAEQAVYRPSNGTWYVRSTSPTTVAWGATGDIPVPGDYDGNGTTDIAVFRPAGGQWYVRAPFSVVSWGQAGDVPVPGDYDGNGTTEQAVYRPANATWYLRSTTPTSTVWGAAGDVPVPLPSAVYRAYF